MAHHAECAAALDRIKRLLGSWGIVACTAGATKDRAMRARLQELWLRRGMRVMTTHTGFRLNRIPAMVLLERRISALMTGQAEGSRRLNEKVLLARAVREMADPATLFLQYSMHHFIFEFFLLVAAETEFTAFSLQQVFSLSCVRVVAEDTIPRLKPCVYVGFVQTQLFLCMTVKTDRVSLLLQKEFRYLSVPQMTRFTVFVRHYLMNILHLKIFVRK